MGFLRVFVAELRKQRQYHMHNAFSWFSLFIWPILGFLEVYYTYRPFSLAGTGLGGESALLAFLGTGYLCYTCYWSMVQNAWEMTYQERWNGTLEVSFLAPASRLAMNYGRTVGALVQQVWMFACFCVFVLLYAGAVRPENWYLLPVVFALLLVSSAVWGGMISVIFLFSRDAEIVMNLLEPPMMLFSGTRVPVSSFPRWGKTVSLLFPLTYCLSLIRFVLGISEGSSCWQRELLLLGALLLAMFLVTVWLLRRAEQHNRRTGELQFY